MDLSVVTVKLDGLATVTLEGSGEFNPGIGRLIQLVNSTERLYIGWGILKLWGQDKRAREGCYIPETSSCLSERNMLSIDQC